MQRLKSKAQLQEHIPKIQESSTQIQPKLKNSLSSPQPVPKLDPPKNQIIANWQKKTHYRQTQGALWNDHYLQNLRNILQYPNEYIHGIILC